MNPDLRGLLRLLLAIALLGAAAAVPAAEQRNFVIFVADGLRNASVNATDSPTLLAVRLRGVNFVNSHSLFPTLTTPNASAIATGHSLGDTGDFGNVEYIGHPVFGRGNFGRPAGSPLPFLENDPVLGDLDDASPAGNYLNEQTLLQVARQHGYNTAAIGKLGPVAIQDIAALKPAGGHFETPQTVILDDATGSPQGVPLSAQMQAALAAAGLTPTPTPRKQPAGNTSTPGTLMANTAQQKWFADAATKAVLPDFARSGKPFILVYWSRDPDGSQHNQGDSLNALQPGINGPTSRAGVADADANLRQLLDYIEGDPQLRATTDVFVTSDHGFATISKHEVDAHGGYTHSYSATFTYRTPQGTPEVLQGYLPPGFLAVDLAHALGQPLYDPDTVIDGEGAAHYAPVDPSRDGSATSRQHPAEGNGLIGGRGFVQEHTDAQVLVAANGGADLIYIAGSGASRSQQERALARTIVTFLSEQDYVGGVFVDDAFGTVPGALPLSAIGLEGSARTPRPSIVVSLRTFRTDPAALTSTAQLADTSLQEGQGMHGSLSRANTFNNMAALGPDFKRAFTNHTPAGNADIAPTIAHILGFELPTVGKVRGRVLTEALVGGPERTASRSRTLRSGKARNGATTILQTQEADGRLYLDSACLATATNSKAALAGCSEDR